MTSGPLFVNQGTYQDHHGPRKGGLIDHALNPANARLTIFASDDDVAFEWLLDEALGTRERSSGGTILNFSELGMVSPELRVIKATITIYYFMRNK